MKEKINKGMYIPDMEHDACGIGFIANLHGEKSHEVVQDALTMLMNMEHRGACGCEPETGDGAGILIQNPHEFYVEVCKEEGIDLPEFGKYGTGMIFFPSDAEVREECRKVFNKHLTQMGFSLLGYRKVPTDNRLVGATARSTEPAIEQVFVIHNGINDPMDLERRLYILKKYTTHYIGNNVEDNNGDFYFSSLSYKTVVYKGQLRTDQLREYYPDLQDKRIKSALALVHSRFSTNTFPQWKLAQPFKYVAHNGEINTVRGNLNWMSAKESMLSSTRFTKEELDLIMPILDPSHSDSANLDSVIELLVMGGRPLPLVMMMVIPEAWEENDLMEEYKKEFYAYQASLMEPWDGPASICFTDGYMVGATLDRNGLRPSRYCLTSDGRVIMASEAGALPVDQSKVIKKGRLQPGKMFIVDLLQGRIISDEELKKDICTRKPYGEWLKKNKVDINDLPPAPEPKYKKYDPDTLRTRQIEHGFTSEDLKVILGPMVEKKTEPVGSMGSDTPLAILSDHSQHLSNYFKQLFAQVSNPPIDPIRERLVMSLSTSFGTSKNLLDETPEHARQISLPHPILKNEQLESLRNIDHIHFKSKTLDITFRADDESGLEQSIDRLCQQAENAARYGVNVIILSDRKTGPTRAPIPSLLATGAVHHHLIRKRLRVHTGIVVEAGDVRETHHYATLLGYGASAINPYLTFESLIEMKENGVFKAGLSDEEIFDNYIEGIKYGLLKIFSKMGISTLHSYQGAQIFEALGINKKVINKCFFRTISRIGGLGFRGIARETIVRHRTAYPNKPVKFQELEVGGVYQWKRRGEYHLFNPETIHLLQQSTRKGNYELYKKYAKLVNDQTRKAATLRGLLDFKKRKPVPLEEVEPSENIFKRFATGAMSFGSISHEAHATLAIAMNRIGGKSNSGEGGEDEIRFDPKPNGDWERSAIKQVASGRFGVTSYYLTNAVELQIKMAQGAKPGEGGQLPGHKVDDWIGRVRHSTPGVGLISPPPHHDIYSIEDLAQLIYDLKNANRTARINVKLVSEAGVGTIAAGVAKAKADVVLVSGHDGGTGASPISSIRHAGLPWELGVAEAHQTLVKNKLRDRIVLQTDGQIKTGRDIAIAALLGAEEWGVATAALVTEGCIMMRKCHMNTCPVGIATQNPDLRKLFTGKPEHVINLFTFLAEELREIMAELGFRTINEMIGQSDVLKMRDDITHWKHRSLDLKAMLYKEETEPGVGLYKMVEQDHGLERALGWKILEVAKPALSKGTPVKAEFNIINIQRSVGAITSNEISKKYKGKGLPAGTIDIKFRGSAGQSFGAFGASGLRFELEGEANDYFGKGLSGAQLIVYPDRDSTFEPKENIIIGNVAFYGATSGEAYIRGQAGERFCVRNSGVKAVVEGVGDHGCEYMTGGIAVVLGQTGRNFAAGMSGGVAYVYDPGSQFSKYCNMEMVDFDEIDLEDEATLKNLIENHYKNTKSDLAKEILDNWSINLQFFIKVMPRDYKRALMNRKKDQMSPSVIN
ncbi:MAG: glutamate synthase large subunit [Cyclobacteriaceae bacterium]|nr:glutamate synthase large subunit [Cyclobacteriaceae bacterium]